jgi:type IV pilus assembly protein PilF
VKSKRACLLLVALMAASGCATSSTIDPKAGASAHMQMGITYLRQNNIPMAMRELSEASTLDPENPEVDLGFGFAYQARGEHEEAVRRFRQAIAKRPGYSEAHNGLGSSLSFLGKSDEALKEFEIAARDVYYTTPELAWFNMGEEYRHLRRFDKADEMYRKAVSLNDKFLDGHLRLAAVRVEENRIDEAAAGLEQAIDRNPGFVQGWLELGRIYMSLGRKDAARKAFLNVSAGSGDASTRKLAAEYINLLDAKR